MAFAAWVKGAINTAMLRPVATASVKGKWTVMQTDITSAAAGFGINALTDADHFWVRVPDGARALIPAVRTSADHSATVTEPVIRIWGLWGTIAKGSVQPDDGSTIRRVDAADADAAGITLSLDTNGTTVPNDATYDYKNPPTWDGYDVRGAEWVLVQVITAGDLTATSADIQGMFLN